MATTPAPMPKGRAGAIAKMTARGKTLPSGLAKPFPGKAGAAPKASKPASGMKTGQAAYKTAKATWKSGKPTRPEGASGKGFGKSAPMTSWRASKPTKTRGMF
jgi:hypothetical protein